MRRSGSIKISDYTASDILKAVVVLVCVASFPALYIFAYNIGLAEPPDLLVPLAFIIAISLIASVLITLLVRDLYAGTVITAAIVILFFSYGHIFLILVNATTPLLKFLGRDIILAPIWLGILILVIVLTLKLKQYLRQAMPAIIVFSIVLVSPLLFQIGSYIIESRQYADASMQPTDTRFYRARVDPLPDVYYIILDGYARADVLQQNFDYDNGEFIRALEQRGFYIATESYSNYPITNISVSSSLNMDYHDAERFEESQQLMEDQYQNIIIPGRVTDILDGLGYDYFANRPPVQETSRAERRAMGPLLFETEFFYILTKSSFLGAVERASPVSVSEESVNDGKEDRGTRRLNRIEREMAHLPEYADDQLPSFVYGHYLSPHPPYKYTESIYEGRANSMDGGPWLDREAYVREVQGLNQTVLDTIDEILARSETPPIIIIQGDHGPATLLYESGLTWGMPARELAAQMPEDVRFERFAILNAYYGPPEMMATLYPSISPVNSFRVVMSYLTDHVYPLLPDRSFIATFERPIEYIEVPELYDAPAP
jgi:hypothetical protein